MAEEQLQPGTVYNFIKNVLLPRLQKEEGPIHDFEGTQLNLNTVFDIAAEGTGLITDAGKSPKDLERKHVLALAIFMHITNMLDHEIDPKIREFKDQNAIDSLSQTFFKNIQDAIDAGSIKKEEHRPSGYKLALGDQTLLILDIMLQSDHKWPTAIEQTAQELAATKAPETSQP